MSTTSDLHAAVRRTRDAAAFPARALVLLALALIPGGCLPGPWDYAPENRPVFQGITVTGYALADRPVEHLCFERLYPLGEASAEAFAFYESAAVSISGTFSNGAQAPLTLTPHNETPNCFTGPAGTRFMRGEPYELTARFVWDSAGSSTVSVLSAIAHIPATFAIADTAFAPSLALLGASLNNLADPAVFSRLPDGPRQLFMNKYGDTLTALQGDSAALAAWLNVHGQRMAGDVTDWLQGDVIPYGRGDSLYYLNVQSGFSNLSHFYKAHRGSGTGSDVKGVLIAHRFDTAASRPVTVFDSLFGIAPDTSHFYVQGGNRRLIFYGDFPNPNGRHLFDSLGVVNPWFWSGRNRLYFYGLEQIAADFELAREENEGNSKLRFPTNVTGGQGFFAGAVVDSFDVYIKLDAATQAFPYPVARAAACRDKGWHDTRDCLDYYPQYCAQNTWTASDCRLDAIYRALDDDSLTLTAALRDSARVWGALDAALREEAARRYCIDHNYPASVGDCAPVQAECGNDQAGNGCQILLWTRCQLAYWDLPACAEGLKSYCRAKRDVHQVMCRDVPEN